MSSILVRNLDPAVKEALAARAAERGRSMESEVRSILTSAARRPRHPNIGLAFRAVGEEVGGIEELPVPTRTDLPRALDLE